MKTFTFGLLVGIFAVLLSVFLYFTSGLAPVATSSPPLPFERILANAALRAHIEREMPKNVLIALNPTNYIAGAEIYRDDCAVCHGIPGAGRTAFAGGMFPPPPQLFHGKGVTDDPPSETYWKVANGIRLTGMPAFNTTLTETQIWQVSVLLANANKLPDSAKQALQPPPDKEVPGGAAPKAK